MRGDGRLGEFKLLLSERNSCMKWITRERPKIDRVACPWLIARFIDNEAEFQFVPADQVCAAAAATGAVPFDVPVSN
jgi:hypothetical protein